MTIPDSILQEFLGALITTSPDRVVRSWSAGAVDLFGFSSDEAVGKNLASLIVPPDAIAETDAAFERALVSQSTSFEAVRVRKDGTRLFVEVSLRLIRDREDADAVIAINERDITTLKYIRDADLLEARFRGLLEAAPDAMLVVDRLGRIVLANSQAQRLFRFARNELLGQPIELLVPERFRPKHAAHRGQYMGTPQQRPMGAGLELYGRRKDGSEFPAEISLSPIEGESGQLATAAIRDVTDRRKTEDKFRGLLEAAPDAMVIVDHSGHIVLVNTQAERMFGFPREELLGLPIEALVPTRFHAEHPAHRAAYSDNPRSRPMGSGLELAGLRKNGTEFPVEISLSPLETEDGTLVTAAIRDITERNEQYRRVQEANRLKSEFLANMSHELRTPLNAIIGFAQLMHDGKVGPVSEQHREYLGDILTSSSHLLQLINDVLDLAKVEAGKLEFRPEGVDIVHVVQETCDVLRNLASLRQIRIITEFDPTLRQVHLDASKLKLVLYNFLSNALKFSHPGAEVNVRVRSISSDAFRLEVQDVGIGIREEDIPRLFVEFQQLDASASKQYPGTGLGLALTKRVVEAQGGRVGVYTAPGRGSTFFALLPRHHVVGQERALVVAAGIPESLT